VGGLSESDQQRCGIPRNSLDSQFLIQCISISAVAPALGSEEMSERKIGSATAMPTENQSEL
jgi:hypothetical protein